MEFKTSKRIDKWIEEHQKKCKTIAFDGAQFTFEFIPTGIVEVQTVKCMCCDKEFTDYID